LQERWHQLFEKGPGKSLIGIHAQLHIGPLHD
jgi:hypothetical protein